LGGTRTDRLGRRRDAAPFPTLVLPLSFIFYSLILLSKRSPPRPVDHGVSLSVILSPLCGTLSRRIPNSPTAIRLAKKKKSV
jgi:hypothetical protein